MADLIATFRDVIKQESEALEQLARTDAATVQATIDIVLGLSGRLICTGMGKSGHIARKMAATFASTGTPAQFVHPGEASHGDLGMIRPGDGILAISNSGETAELADMLTYARRFGIPLIAITKRGDSALARHADMTLPLPDVPEACAIAMAPTTSTTCSLVIGDALAVAVMTAKGFAREDFLIFHPGGKLGARLLTVAALMHTGAAVPRLRPEQTMAEGIIEMTAKGFGISTVVDGDDRLVGVLTDGDLRRNLSGLMDRKVGEVANRAPKTIPPDALASEALAAMNATSVTALCVTDTDSALVGLIHMHDCLRTGVA